MEPTVSPYNSFNGAYNTNAADHTSSNTNTYTPFPATSTLDQGIFTNQQILYAPPPEGGDPLGVPVQGHEILFFGALIILYFVFVKRKGILSLIHRTTPNAKQKPLIK